MSINSYVDGILESYKRLEEENDKLKLELKMLKIDSMQLSDLLTDEEVILKQNPVLINNVLDKISTIEKPLNKRAVLIAIADCSGSMGIWEKYMGKSYLTWVKELLNKKYSHVEERFLLHHTEAKEVTSEEFHGKGEGGGTIASTGIKLTSSIIEEYNYEDIDDIFVVYITDGDNLTSDCPRFKKLLTNRVLNKVENFTYFEVNQYNRHSTLRTSALKDIKQEGFKQVVLYDKNDMKAAVDNFHSELTK
ncbi:DUF444 family protein [Sporosarcina globispora]|uniref:DUF444 family protein n=1 Tax=Sporosarcina globispora TaxID=1459 RepID=UPI0006A95A0E|nr:DUF444 family protein [Sporosarcina globispora]